MLCNHFQCDGTANYFTPNPKLNDKCLLPRRGLDGRVVGNQIQAFQFKELKHLHPLHVGIHRSIAWPCRSSVKWSAAASKGVIGYIQYVHVSYCFVNWFMCWVFGGFICSIIYFQDVSSLPDLKRYLQTSRSPESRKSPMHFKQAKAWHQSQIEIKEVKLLRSFWTSSSNKENAIDQDSKLLVAVLKLITSHCRCWLLKVGTTGITLAWHMEKQTEIWTVTLEKKVKNSLGLQLLSFQDEIYQTLLLPTTRESHAHSHFWDLAHALTNVLQVTRLPQSVVHRCHQNRRC